MDGYPSIAQWEAANDARRSERELELHKRNHELRKQVWQVLDTLNAPGENEMEILQSLKGLMSEISSLRASEEFLIAERKRKKAHEGRLRDEQQKALQKEQSRIACELREAEYRLRQAELTKKKAEIELAQSELLAIEGRKSALAAWSISIGALEPITEERIQSIVNTQRRSLSGPIRVSKGDGK